MANFCTNCGNPVGENDGFCINCGKKILKIQGQTQPKTLDLIAGLDGAAGNSAAGAVSATANIRNPFLTLFSGARSLVFGFPNLLKKPKALIIAIALTILWTVLGIVNWRAIQICSRIFSPGRFSRKRGAAARWPASAACFSRLAPSRQKPALSIPLPHLCPGGRRDHLPRDGQDSEGSELFGHA